MQNKHIFTGKYAIVSLLCALMLTGAGCSTGARGGYVASPYNSAPEEIVEAPNLPQDDGLPLSQAERIAFNSTGQLDKNLSPADLKLVELHYKYYLHKQRGSFNRFLSRSEGYLPYVQDIFRQEGVPEEVAYLAIVESGFNPNAVSSAGATGMWQFMLFTGQRYGLQKNAWIDERRDPYKATVAAAQYLKMLYGMFGDWQLAIASYNAGEGKISRALKQTKATSFFELLELNDTMPEEKMQLRLETQQYVPRFLAVAKIMRNLELLGFTAPDPAKAHNVVPLNVGPGTDLGALAKSTGMDWDKFKACNPAYISHISPPFASTVAYIPVDKSSRAKVWLANAKSARFAGWQQYKVRSGDSLYAISGRHGVSISVLREANKLKSNTLRPGQALLVPGAKPVSKPGTAYAAGKPTAPASYASASGSKGVTTVHTVRSGENLYRIAQSYGVSIASLQQANNMKSGASTIAVGQRLRIPGNSVQTQSIAAKPAVSASAAKPAGKAVASAKGKAKSSSVVVQKGDTLYSIASRNNTSVDNLMRINGLSGKGNIYPGQQLRLN